MLDPPDDAPGRSTDSVPARLRPSRWPRSWTQCS
jgi:hypothetical protein